MKIMKSFLVLGFVSVGFIQGSSQANQECETRIKLDPEQVRQALYNLGNNNIYNIMNDTKLVESLTNSPKNFTEMVMTVESVLSGYRNNLLVRCQGDKSLEEMVRLSTYPNSQDRYIILAVLVRAYPNFIGCVDNRI